VIELNKAKKCNQPLFTPVKLVMVIVTTVPHLAADRAEAGNGERDCKTSRAGRGAPL